MADPIADNAQLAVDELRRKARRRLIGAIVLALAAATLLPLLLEQEQKPLGDDVSIQIPPIDDGKFVTRLPGDKAKEGAGKAESKAEPKTDAKADSKSEPKAEAKAEPKVDAKSDAKVDLPAPKVEPKAEPKSETKAEPKAASPSAPNAATGAATSGSSTPGGGAQATPSAPGATVAASAPSGTSPPAADAPGKAEGFIVQLGAFTDTYGANALANRLKRAGYPAFTQPVETSRGKMWRVRVGGYPTRAAANEARDKLKAEGHDGIVVAAK